MEESLRQCESILSCSTDMFALIDEDFIYEIIEKLTAGLGGLEFEFLHYTLTCDEKTLRSRLESDANRTTDIQIALRRRQECFHLRSSKIDTAGKAPKQLAKEMSLLLAN